MNFNLKLPTKQRSKFAEPLDVLIAGSRQDTILEVENIFKDYEKSKVKFQFYLVGDIVTQDFLSNAFLKTHIKLCVIDKKTKRVEVNVEGKQFFERTVEFENETGTIQKESWPLLKEIINSNKRTLLVITEGEEDLLVIPLVLQLPLESNVKRYVFYGQPPITDAEFTIPQGIVVADIDAGIQNKVKELVSLMEKC